MTDQQTTALERVLPSSPLQKIEDVQKHMRMLVERANLVSPFATIDYVPPMQKVSFRVVTLDTALRAVKQGDRTNYVGTDTYRDSKFCAEDERALTKTGILKLLRAAGITILESHRLDDRTDSRLVAWRVVIEVPELDGGFTRYKATKELDFRPGSPQSNQMTEKQAVMAAVMMLENAETKALLRAARAALQLRQKYTVAELQKPFVIPVLVPDLDMSDPEIKKMVAAKALGITRDIFGGPREEPKQTIDIDPGKVEVVDLNTGEVLDDDDPAAANAAAGGEDLSAFAEPDQQPAGPVCGCPCGCKTEVTEAAAAATTKNRGVIRCAECYPSKAFNLERHKSLATLGMNPDLTVKQAAEMRDSAIKRATA